MNTLAQLISTFLEWMERDYRPGTIYYYRHHLKGFREYTGDVSLSELKAFHLMKWGDTWHRVACVKRLFHWAKDEAQLIDFNPFRHVHGPHKGQRKRIFTRAALTRFIRAARHDFRRLLIGMRETLSRPGEARGFCWSMVRFY